MADMAGGDDDHCFCLCFFVSALSQNGSKIAGGNDDDGFCSCFFASALSQNG